MKYVLLIYSQEAPERWAALPEAEQQSVMREYEAISREPGTLDGAQLQPAETATTVRVENGTTLTTDGPFAETKEVLGGYYLIEAESLDAAVGWAKRLRHEADGSIEIRPLLELGVDSGPPGSS